MSLTDFMRRVRNDRRETVELYGTPIFRHVFGIIAASGGREQIELRDRFPAAVKYLPLESAVIVNRATEALLVEVNGQSLLTIPGLSTFNVTDEYIWQFALVNNEGTATTAGEVETAFQTPALDSHKVARRQYYAR